MKSQTAAPIITMFAVIRDDNKYLAGFDPQQGQAVFTDDVFGAKLFTSKYEASLRPNERLVEITVQMTWENVTVSTPFRPKRRETVSERVSQNRSILPTSVATQLEQAEERAARIEG